ncbi:hypothetical protein ASPSYDRAFT_44903 [Aspergillus sydowii CBS 593.65]|uniref:Uncharacterized protein n=1 Tax=Aspergillus sydowii CBS 593.65 TaxID=1036612 RepID=A0A1L9TGH7_9EURO|nr:uncharacterized protein ASPSYDRAFT_44903 [Aspergillus sydowii CBS 593.65]OJJ58537.1 hypothetical protein ASPSYDRAFT_44903 [Aspergillus sydowii CBS 593.65]
MCGLAGFTCFLISSSQSASSTWSPPNHQVEWIPNTYQDGDPSVVLWISRIPATERVQVTSLPAGAPWVLSKTMRPFGLWAHE